MGRCQSPMRHINPTQTTEYINKQTSQIQHSIIYVWQYHHKWHKTVNLYKYTLRSQIYSKHIQCINFFLVTQVHGSNICVRAPKIVCLQYDTLVVRFRFQPTTCVSFMRTPALQRNYKTTPRVYYPGLVVDCSHIVKYSNVSYYFLNFTGVLVLSNQAQTNCGNFYRYHISENFCVMRRYRWPRHDRYATDVMDAARWHRFMEPFGAELQGITQPLQCCVDGIKACIYFGQILH